MKRFRLGQRVVVDAAQNHGVEIQLAAPTAGTVTRLRLADEGAWINLDRRLAQEDAHPFPASDKRANHVLAYPEHCEPEPQ